MAADVDAFLDGYKLPVEEVAVCRDPEPPAVAPVAHAEDRPRPLVPGLLVAALGVFKVRVDPLHAGSVAVRVLECRHDRP